ncbi:MAG: hypothetical protein JNL39_23005 [Opitutaceae bacterium]|nr:hypothetical protein [Opitutaceae bacterium]
MLPLLARLALFLAVVIPLAAQPAPTPAAAATKPSATELAYWIQLQKDLAALRSANLAAGLGQGGPLGATPENVSAAVSRLEKFLDRLDKDPVADLGADYKEYRERLMKLCDLALTPLTGAAKFKSTVITEGEQRMMTAFKITKEIEAVDDYKPRLALLHDSLDRRAQAAGSEPRFFFQILGIGDKPRAAGSLGSPEERDAQFLKDAAAIGPIYAEVAKGHFVANRVKQGLSEGLMEPFLDAVSKFRTQFADAPTDQLQEAIKTNPSLKEGAGNFILKLHVIRIELARRADLVAHTIAMQEFQGAFRRWLGKADDVAPLGLCRDVAVAADGSWFAYAPAERTIVVRDTATGKVRHTLTAAEAVRALAATDGPRLLAFTAAGINQIDLAAPEPKFELRANRRSAFLEGRIAHAPKASRVAYGLGVMPAFTSASKETTFTVPDAASRITAVAIDATGATFAIGFAGDNLTGAGQPRYGADLLQVGSAQAVETGVTLKSRQLSPPLRLASMGLALSADGRRLAGAWSGRFGGAVTLDDLSGEKSVQTIFTLDGESYTWVQLLEGDKPRIVAGTRHGIVRVWDVASRDLLARFDVPAGPDGVAYGCIGAELVTVALGSVGVHRWKLADGAHAAAYAGEPVTATPAKLAAERALFPARETLIALARAADDNERLKHIETLRGPQAAMLDAIGQRPTVDYWRASLRQKQVRELRRSKRVAEAFELGAKEIDAGLLDANLVHEVLLTGNRAFNDGPNPALRARLAGLAGRAVALYPAHVGIRIEYLTSRSDQFSEQGKLTEALREIDQLDIIEPAKAPHNADRHAAYLFAYNLALKGGRKAEALQHLTAMFDFITDKNEALTNAQRAFGLAYELRNWKSAVQFANAVLNMNPNMKNDQNFMNAAKYAYAQQNPAPAPQKK